MFNVSWLVSDICSMFLPLIVSHASWVFFFSLSPWERTGIRAHVNFCAIGSVLGSALPGWLREIDGLEVCGSLGCWSAAVPPALNRILSSPLHSMHNEWDMLLTRWEKDTAVFMLFKETDPLFPSMCNPFHAAALTVFLFIYLLCLYLFK